MLRLCIVDTHAYTSSQQAKGHFAEFGISSQNPQVITAANRQRKEKAEKDNITSYPDQHLDQICFPKALVVKFCRPVIEWKKDDDKFKREWRKANKESQDQQEETKAASQSTNLKESQRQKNSQQKFLDTLRSYKVPDEGEQYTCLRKIVFISAVQLKEFLMAYDMKLEKLLRAIAMDENCKSDCGKISNIANHKAPNDHTMSKFGLSPC